VFVSYCRLETEKTDFVLKDKKLLALRKLREESANNSVASQVFLIAVDVVEISPKVEIG
jgi:hypothetical protein